MSYDLASSFLTIQQRDIKEYIYTIYAKIVSNYPKCTSPAAAAAKSLHSCPTLCDPIDGSPPGSPDPGILQARTLEWVAISFSNAWKWKVKVKSFSHVRPSATPWTAAFQAPPSTGFSRQEYPVGCRCLLHTSPNSWKLETTQLPLNRRVNKHICRIFMQQNTN